VRITTVLRRLIGVMSLFVVSFRWEDGSLILGVRPTWLCPRCGECGTRRPGYDTVARPRRWRALSYGFVLVYLEYQLRRVRCGPCGGVRVEAVPWAAHDSWFTRAFEELVAYHAQVMDKTAVTKLLGVSWEAIGNIIERVVARRLDDFTISLIAGAGLPKRRASSACAISSGSRNSCSSISPGCVGGRSAGRRRSVRGSRRGCRRLVVVDDFDFIRVPLLESEGCRSAWVASRGLLEVRRG
jgi:hypothetical protein